MAALNIGNRTIFTHDNLDILREINSECIDLIYLDPPFNSGVSWHAPLGSDAEGASFDDIWSWETGGIKEQWLDAQHIDSPVRAVVDAAEKTGGAQMAAYLAFMGMRLIEMHRILQPTGSIYLHCDPTAAHYLKMMLDAIFGTDSFRNEIIWHYRGGALTSARSIYPRKHDTILFYSRGNRYTFNTPREDEISDQMTRRWGKYLENDGRTVLYGSIKHEKSEEARSRRRIERDLGRQPKDDDIAFTVKPSLLRSVWTDIPEIRNNPRYKESVGFPTQKPLALLERIITASSNPGDVVLDPFCGCATACVAAERLGRRWIGIDVSEMAVLLCEERITEMQNESGQTNFGIEYHPPTQMMVPPERSDLDDHKEEIDRRSTTVKQDLYERQDGVCNGCRRMIPPELSDLMDLDHIVPRSKGGRHTWSNVQLLCRTCNVKKGNRSMSDLLTRLSTERGE